MRLARTFQDDPVREAALDSGQVVGQVNAVVDEVVSGQLRTGPLTGALQRSFHHHHADGQLSAGHLQHSRTDGRWWEVVGGGGRWWEVMGGIERWWGVVGGGGMWWEVVGCGGTG